MIPRDDDLVLRDGTAGNLTGSASYTFNFTIPEGSYRRPMAVHVLVPSITASDTLNVTVKSTTTDHKVEVTHTDALTASKFPTVPGSLPGTITLPIPWSRATAWSVVLTPNASGDEFGAVQVWVAEANVANVPQT